MSLNFKKCITWFFMVGLLIILSSCAGGGACSNPPNSNKSNLNAITTFSLPSANGPINAVINGLDITVTVPFGTNLTALIATFTTTGQSVAVGGTPQLSNINSNDFTNPVTYKVTAANGTTALYTVKVTVAANSANAITAFSLPSANGPINAVINGLDITITVPFGTNSNCFDSNFHYYW